MKILVVVASGTGRTQLAAEAFAEGASREGAQVDVVASETVTDGELLAADAIALGSAVHMGSVASAMTAFFERTVPFWFQGSLRGKLGAAFVCGSKGERGGGELALLALHAYLAQHGLMLVPMPNHLKGFRETGCHWGALLETHPHDGPPGPTEAQLVGVRSHGEHVARCTARWLAGQPDA